MFVFCFKVFVTGDWTIACSKGKIWSLRLQAKPLKIQMILLACKIVDLSSLGYRALYHLHFNYFRSRLTTTARIMLPYFFFFNQGKPPSQSHCSESQLDGQSY